MSQRRAELEMRRRALLLRSERLRSELAVEQRAMLEALSGVDRAISTARRLAPPLLLMGAGALLLRMFRGSHRRAAGAGLAVKALFWVSMAKRVLPYATLVRSLWRARSAARAAEASAAPDGADSTYP